MPSRGYAIAFIAAALTFSSASAATITAATSKENKTTVSLTGEIVEGDADKLKEIIRSANEAVRLVSGMRFDSPGGNLLEGVKLAGIIRSAKISTVVANGAKCASACFVAFAAGSQKFVSYTARIGVHGASDGLGQEAGDATLSMARIVKELGVPEGIIGKMVITRASEIAWLSPDDLRSMGVTMTGKPAQIAPDQSTVSGWPMQLPSAPAPRVIAPPTRLTSAPCATSGQVDAYMSARREELRKQYKSEYPQFSDYIIDQQLEKAGFGNPANKYKSSLERANEKLQAACPP
jgi:hypothetical protein